LINPTSLSGDYKTKYKKQKLINYTAIPLGLAYIAAVLEKNGHDVKVLDAAVHEIDYKLARVLIKRTSPDAVAIASFTPTFNYAVEYANIVKGIDPDIPTIVGGPHVTFLPEKSLRDGKSIDFVIRGEGDFTTSYLINALERNEPNLKEVKGISYRNNGSFIHTPDAPLIQDLDTIPFPARHLFPNHLYHFFGSTLKGTSMVSSRGCNRQCAFCSITQFYHHRWRKRSALNVVKEMRHVHDKYKTTIIGLMDDCFALSKRRVYEICDYMKDYGLVGDLCWGAALRVDNLNYDILNKMRRSDCAMLFFGVESGDQKVLDRVQKGTTTKMIEDVFRWAHKLGINTIASLALGLPGDTFEGCLRTIEWVKRKLKPSFVVWAAATPYPGTPFYEEAIEKGWIKEDVEDFSSYTMMDPVLNLTDMTKEDVKNLIKYAYKSMHLNLSYLINRFFYEIRQGVELYGTLSIFRQFIQVVFPFLSHIKKYGMYPQLLPKNPEEWKT